VSQDAPTPADRITTDGRGRFRAASDTWAVVRKYWVTAAVTAVITFLAVTFYTLGQTKIYEAQATVHFDPNPPRPLGSRVENVVDMGSGAWWDNREYYETQYYIIRSRRIALTVVNDLGLQNDAAFLQNTPPGQDPRPGSPVAPELAAETLRGRITVQAVRDSRLATVTLRDANPERAQRLLAAVLEAYVNTNLNSALDSTSSATDWLRNQLDTLKKDLETSELELHRYKKKNDILSVAFDDKSSMLSGQMKQITEELTRVKGQLQGVAARRSVLADVPEDDPTVMQATELLNSPLLNILRESYQSAVRERDALRGTKKGENHPEVAAADRRVKAAEAAILKEIRNVKGAVSRDVNALSRHAGGLQAMLDEARKQAHELNLLEIEYNRLSRGKINTEKLYAMVLERTKEADLTQMLRVNNVSVLDRPLKPESPVHPRVPLNLAFGAFVGLLLGIGAAVGRNFMDRTLKLPEDIEEELGLACLGLLPQLSKTNQTGTYGRTKRRRGRRADPDIAPELIVHHEPMSALAEAARTIRTNLMFMSPDDPHKVILVTSAGPAEGKTTVACCIGIAMAHAGMRVALIDCDLRRPRLHRVFRLSSEAGVTSALLDDSLDDVICSTEIPDLSVVPAGPIPPHPAELFHTEKFRRVLASMRERFDRVIIDSPPVGVVTDPAVLSTLADGTVLVVRAHRTRREIARYAVRALQSVGGHLGGVVLNAVDFSRTEYKYSYYYYRRDEYYTPQPQHMSESSSAGAAPPAN
jgi:capsular exopolysaccharide synthesis family protein